MDAAATRAPGGNPPAIRGLTYLREHHRVGELEFKAALGTLTREGKGWEERRQRRAKTPNPHFIQFPSASGTTRGRGRRGRCESRGDDLGVMTIGIGRATHLHGKMVVLERVRHPFRDLHRLLTDARLARENAHGSAGGGRRGDARASGHGRRVALTRTKSGRSHGSGHRPVISRHERCARRGMTSRLRVCFLQLVRQRTAQATRTSTRREQPAPACAVAAGTRFGGAQLLEPEVVDNETRRAAHSGRARARVSSALLERARP